MDFSREETFEDDTITDPAERTRIFCQYDHRRIYGRDYADRLRSAGFAVADIDFAASLTEADLNQFSRMLTKLTVETALNAELTDHLRCV